LAIYGKEAADEVADAKEGDKGQNLVPVKPGEMVRTETVEPKGLKTRPPARYSEATLLGAMEGAGKLIDDEELREAMQEKGLGTPATRAATIEGLITEKYMLRDGREMIPTAKAFQLMTLLRGLGVEELSKPALTGDWEYKLAQMEHGKLSRDAFMLEIAEMTKHIVQKAKEYDRDTIPGDYATLSTPCPNCGGVVKENYRRYTCTGKTGDGVDACGFSFGKTPAGRTFEPAEVEVFLAQKKIGPLEGFRSKAGWPFTAEIVLKYNDEDKNWKLEFDFGDDKNAEDSGEIIDFSGQDALGACPKCGAKVFEHGSNYVCEKSVPTAGPAHAQLRLQERQDHLAAARGARAGGQAAERGQDRLARQVCQHAHAPRLQGLPDLEQGRGQGDLRVRAPHQQVPAAQKRCGQNAGGENNGGQSSTGRQKGRSQESPSRQEGCQA
jgi:DNA topoisomerase-3